MNEIQHISDTALLVAAARAVESELPNPLIRDPYAARLAGERGIALTHSWCTSRWRSFGIALRTRFIDDFLLAGIAAVDCVVCLGAGLDARPWRLDLPENLRWIEVDFAAVLDYKHGILKDVEPRCRLEQISADLNDEQDREALLDEVMHRGSQVLLLTEGLLFYLPAETVHALARAKFHSWIAEIAPPRDFMLARQGDSAIGVMEMRAETCLDGVEVANAICAAGWVVSDKKTFVKDGRPFAIQRVTRDGWAIDPNAPKLAPDDPAGVWLFRRTG